MITRINHTNGFTVKTKECRDVIRVSASPDQRYAVAETSPGVFVAMKVTSLDEDLLIGEFVNSCVYSVDTPMLNSIFVDWGCIGFGFCKLILWAPEWVNEFGGFENTIERFYFDWELYKTCYEKLHGVPCKKKNPNAGAAWDRQSRIF